MNHASLQINLTPREMEVLAGIVYGAKALEIANALYISKRTVEFHIANIIDKCHARNAVHAMRTAQLCGAYVPDVLLAASIESMLARIEKAWQSERVML